MKCKFAAILLAVVTLFAAALAAQTGAAPAPAAPAATTSAPGTAGPGKIGVIDVQTAILATNEGQRDFNALNTKFDPKRNELQAANKEIDDLKKQLQAQNDKLNEDARTSLVRSIEQKQKAFQRNSEDAQNDYQAQQNEIVQRILAKLAPVVKKYATDNGLALLIDVSNPWPQGPVLWAVDSVNITKNVVDAYNAQSGVPSPPRPATAGAPGGGAARPATAPARPAAPAGGTAAPKPKPQTTTPPR